MKERWIMSRSGQYIKQLTGYKAFIPNPLPPNPPIKFDKDFSNLLSKADRAIAGLDAICYLLPNPDFFIAMYVKKEALLSSQIEGTQASLEDVFVFEKGKHLENIDDVSEVINYIKALNYGMERLNELPMSLRLFREIHGILLQGVRGKDKTPGEFRKTQNWIGPPGCSLKDAKFIPTPHTELYDALGNLEKYFYYENSYPALIDCALIHYQFETIHPFLDGNGRLGRLIITFYLSWKGIIQKPLLYLSYYLKKNKQEYYDRLDMAREKGDFEQWITFFLKGIIETSNSAVNTAKAILVLQKEHQLLLWKNKLSSAYANVFLDNLFYNPLITVKDVTEILDISYRSASKLVNQFEKAGILKEVTGKKRGKEYLYKDYLDILSEGTGP